MVCLMKEGGAGRRRSSAESPDNGNKCGSMPPCIRFGLPPHYSSIICMPHIYSLLIPYSMAWNIVENRFFMTMKDFLFVPYFYTFKIYILISIFWPLKSELEWILFSFGFNRTVSRDSPLEIVYTYQLYFKRITLCVQHTSVFHQFTKAQLCDVYDKS